MKADEVVGMRREQPAPVQPNREILVGPPDRLETAREIMGIPSQPEGGEKPRSPYWNERDEDGHCTRCGQSRNEAVNTGPAQRILEVDVSDLRFEQAFIEHGWDERRRDIRWQVWQAAILAERERCAKIAESEFVTRHDAEEGRAGEAIADAIRRGEGV